MYGNIEATVPYTACGLTITPHLGLSSVAAVQALVDGTVQGWWSSHDRMGEFDGDLPPDLVDAEVCAGLRTVVVRRSGGVWNVWVWQQTSGGTHRAVTEWFASSAPNRSSMSYITYWTPRSVDGVDVWTAVGARFAGWGE